MINGNLTMDGYLWARAHAADSIVARVALQAGSAYAGAWPSVYVVTAQTVCNAAALREARS